MDEKPKYPKSVDIPTAHAPVVKLVNTQDLKSCGRKTLPIQLRPGAPLLTDLDTYRLASSWCEQLRFLNPNANTADLYNMWAVTKARSPEGFAWHLNQTKSKST